MQCIVFHGLKQTFFDYVGCAVFELELQAEFVEETLEVLLRVGEFELFAHDGECERDAHSSTTHYVPVEYVPGFVYNVNSTVHERYTEYEYTLFDANNSPVTTATALPQMVLGKRSP